MGPEWNPLAISAPFCSCNAYDLMSVAQEIWTSVMEGALGCS